MSAQLKYWEGRSKGNDFEEACPEGWEWSQKGGGYDKGRDFFRLHWSVVKRRGRAGVDDVPAKIIRLHVESPRYEVDPVLNDIKAELVAALLGSDVRQRILESGFLVQAGSKTGSEEIKRNKSTEAFRVLLDDRQRVASNRESIAMVHEALGRRWAPS